MVAGSSPMHFFDIFCFAKVCPSQRMFTCRFIIHWTPASRLISMIVDTCDSSSSFCSLSCCLGMACSKPPSTKSWNRCGHGFCSNGWVKLFILESGRVPAAYHLQFEACVTNHLRDYHLFLRCERFFFGICMCRVVECCCENAVASYG